MSNPELKISREPERLQLTGLSRVQWWRLEREGKVPRRIQLGTNSVGWLKHELEDWIARRAAQRSRAVSVGGGKRSTRRKNDNRNKK